MADPCFASVDTLWKELTEPASFFALLASLEPLNVTRFDFYNGFDAKALIEGLTACAIAAKRSKAEFYQDVSNIVLIGLCRGNIRQDQLVEGRCGTRIKELAMRYKIKLRANAQERSATGGNAMTFTRSISLFPHIASLLLNKSNSLARDCYSSTLKTDLLPACMKHSGFSALIPEGINKTVQEIFLLAHTAYMIDFTRMINPNKRNTSVKELCNTQTKFNNISQEKSMYSDNVRVGYLKALNLHTAENFDKVLTVANNLHTEVNGTPINIVNVRNEVLRNNAVILDK